MAPERGSDEVLEVVLKGETVQRLTIIIYRPYAFASDFRHSKLSTGEFRPAALDHAFNIVRNDSQDRFVVFDEHASPVSSADTPQD